MAQHPISRFADTVGDGTGVIDAIGNYSDAGLGLTSFKIAPAAGETFEVQRMIIYIEDFGTLDADSYGNGITLTNGIDIKVYRDTPADDEVVLWNVIHQTERIISNTGWKALCHDEIPSTYGQGNESVTYRYTFSRDGSPIILTGDNKEELRIILNDDFSGLIHHYFRIGMKQL